MDVVGNQIELMEVMIFAKLLFWVQTAVFVGHKLVKRQSSFAICIVG